MSKKRRKKSRHRIPNFTPKPDPISERYQAEVDRDTDRSVKAYAAAEKRLERAKQKARLAEAQVKRSRMGQDGKRDQGAWETACREVERRERELLEIAMLMQPEGRASAQHRGRKSYRPVPN